MCNHRKNIKKNKKFTVKFDSDFTVLVWFMVRDFF